MQRLKPFFTYFGGKWRISKHYPPPTHSTIVEPFAGSAGYSLNYYFKNVMLYDLDPIIFSVWDYLIHVSENEVLSLPLVISDLRDMVLPQPAKYLIGFWLNKGMISPCNIPGKWMREYDGKFGQLNTYWGAGVRQRIASQLQYIRHWKIENKSYADIDNERATWFVDPPYQRSGIHYRFNAIDFSHLGEWCIDRNGQVCVCEQEGANWLPFQPFRVIKALEGKKGSKQSREVIWKKYH